MWCETSGLDGSASRAPSVKARLLDQSIAGVGNLLADEALWSQGAARHPGQPAARKDADRLYRALQAALASAIAQGGVHTGEVIAARRPGGTCPRCGAEMRHGTVGGRSTWWCSREQAPWPAPGIAPRVAGNAVSGRSWTAVAVIGSRQPCIWARAFSVLRQPAVVSSRLASDASWVRSSAAVTQSLTT